MDPKNDQNTNASTDAKPQTAAKPPAKKAAAKPAASPRAKDGQAPPKKKPEPGVTVKGPEKGRRRIGRSFGAQAETIPLSDLKKGDLEALQADPQLVVVVSGED